MSKTAGAALGEYTAINPLSVASLLTGLCGVLVALGPVLAIVPAIGLILGVVAVVQIIRSAGTQVGIWPASIGILLSVLACGYTGYGVWHQASLERAHRQSISLLVGDFAARLGTKDYDGAYSLLDPRAQLRIAPERFATIVSNLQNTPTYGRIVSGTCGQRLDLTVDSLTSNTVAEGLMLLKLDASAFGATDDRGARERAIFWLVDGSWRIHDVPSWFGQERQPR